MGGRARTARRSSALPYSDSNGFPRIVLLGFWYLLLCPISNLIGNFRLKPEVIGKSLLTPKSNRIEKVKGKSDVFVPQVINFQFKPEIIDKTGLIKKSL